MKYILLVLLIHTLSYASPDKWAPIFVGDDLTSFVSVSPLASTSTISDNNSDNVPHFPFPQQLTYSTDIILPNNYSRATMNNDVSTFYTQWKSDYLVAEGNENGHDLYRIALGKAGTNHDITVSEGQGYGMLISVIMAGYDTKAQTIFDGLWYFSKKYPSGINPQLISWHIPIADSGNDSAFDGDADIAYALLMADKQWGSNGTINYAKEASTLIAAIYTSTIGLDSNLPMLGDWVDMNGNTYNQYTNRPSDFMPSHFQAFSSFTHNSDWLKVATTARETINSIQKNYSSTTGLIPDFINHSLYNDIWEPEPASNNFLEGEYDGQYYYNACRVPLRYGMDALFTQDSTSKTIITRMATWMADTYSSPYDIKSGYRLDGSVLAGSDYFSTVFVAPFGVAAMNVPNQQNWLNLIYNAVKSTHEDYYQDSINLLSLIVMTGNFWYPKY